MNSVLNYFKLLRTDSKGAILLTISIVSIVLIVHLIAQQEWRSVTEIQPLGEKIILSACEKNLPDSLKSYPNYCAIYERKKPIRPYERQDRNRRLFPFDPNELSKEEALELGFGAHAASSLMHFLAKGGRIKYKSDLKKIYGMNDKIYKRLEPYITLDTEEQYLAMNKYLTENPRKKYPYDKKQYANNANKAYKHYDYTNNYKHDSLFKQKKYWSHKIDSTKEWTYQDKKTYEYTNEKFDTTRSRYATKYKDRFTRNDTVASSSYDNKEPSYRSYPTTDTSNLLMAKNEYPYKSNNQRDTSTTSKTKYKKANYNKTPKTKQDLNKIGIEELMDLPLIGAKRAEAIVKIRNQIGGFSSLEQMASLTKNLPDSILIILENHLFIGDYSPKKIDINRDSLEVIKSHPAFGYKIAKAIISYRNQHGPYTKKEDVQKSYLITKKIYEQIEPFIEVSKIE